MSRRVWPGPASVVPVGRHAAVFADERRGFEARRLLCSRFAARVLPYARRSIAAYRSLDGNSGKAGADVRPFGQRPRRSPSGHVFQDGAQSSRSRCGFGSPGPASRP